MTTRKRYLALSRTRFAFEPFQVPSRGVSLSGLNAPPDLELILFTRNGSTRALVAREMAYHHVAQGELEGQPYIISF